MRGLTDVSTTWGGQARPSQASPRPPSSPPATWRLRDAEDSPGGARVATPGLSSPLLSSSALSTTDLTTTTITPPDTTPTPLYNCAICKLSAKMIIFSSANRNVTSLLTSKNRKHFQ